MENGHKPDGRPLSPNIQIYRPQLTSVLSIANRISGVVLAICSIALVGWLIAAAIGPRAYARFQLLVGTWPAQLLLLGATYAFYLHLLGGIRHLLWDAVYGFELRQIYGSGWLVVAGSLFLSLMTWLAVGVM